MTNVHVFKAAQARRAYFFYSHWILILVSSGDESSESESSSDEDEEDNDDNDANKDSIKSALEIP